MENNKKEPLTLNGGGDTDTNHEPRTTNHDLSFEEAYRQLAELVKKMEDGTLPLADSVSAYERAMKLKAYCEQLLKQAEAKIEQLNPAEKL
ncbi:MAG: exodeoxyribonuclease VII small subunit [Rickettsiales bacterium]|jgi:exodeoxyribonuclease VII small subunit|nr:exodeoxyribonuclease VII small subunit [Rickettsiales bacterium]